MVIIAYLIFFFRSNEQIKDSQITSTALPMDVGSAEQEAETLPTRSRLTRAQLPTSTGVSWGRTVRLMVT